MMSLETSVAVVGLGVPAGEEKYSWRNGSPWEAPVASTLLLQEGEAPRARWHTRGRGETFGLELFRFRGSGSSEVPFRFRFSVSCFVSWLEGSVAGLSLPFIHGNISHL